MKRMTYVDNNGNETNISYERRKPLLKFFLIFNIILPIIITGLFIYNIFINKKCIKVYDAIKTSSFNYIQDQDEIPSVEGDSINIDISDLYIKQYLNKNLTNNNLCSGTVVITKYKDEYVYKLDIKNCDKCSTNIKYGKWSKLQTTYPKNKAIVEVIPYFNYYDRELNITKWSKYYEEEELDNKESKYGINLPLDTSELPEIPEEAKETNIESDTTYYYRYQDRSWKWYDIEGDYSEFSSEKPQGFENKDSGSEKYTEWTEYSLNYPEEKDYRQIDRTTGYKFYYINKKGKKIYYNSGKYTPKEEINTDKYNMYDEKTSELFRYRDKQWRWYNGQKRTYSTYLSKPTTYLKIKDIDTEILNNPTSWSEKRYNDATTAEYRIEEKKLMTRFRRQYEILTLLAMEKPLEKAAFEEKENMSITEFSSRDDKKLEVTYKFRYRKS